MVMFDNIEDLFQELRDFNDYSKALVTFATAIGALVIFIYTLKILYSLSQGLRLYILSQWSCCQSNYIERYGKWAVISGSTDGIGLGIAKEFARRGHSILVIGRNEEKLARTKELLEGIENVGEVETVRIDLSDSSLENFERIREQIDPDNRDIGILVNNAGTFNDKFHRFNNNNMKFLREMINVNVIAAVHLTKMVMPGMLERQKGLILNVTSLIGLHPTPYTNLYCATKQFMFSFTESLQVEYSGHNLDIINLSPGPVNTKLLLNTNSFKSSNLLNPEPDDFARSAINALSTRIGLYSGTMAHGLMGKGQLLAYNFGLNPLLMRLISILYPKTLCISPVMKRKNQQQTGNQSSITIGDDNQTNNQENVFNKTMET